MITTLSTTSVNVNVSVPGIGFFAQTTVTHEQHKAVDLNRNTYLRLDRSTENKTIVVSADKDVSVYVLGNKGSNTDGFLAIPTSAFGKKYMILSF